MKRHTTFATGRASRYLKALCHHFGRKVDAENDGEKGWVQFPFGRCELSANENQLGIVVIAETQPQLRQVMTIVTSHLERFAFRENPTLEWQDDATASA